MKHNENFPLYGSAKTTVQETIEVGATQQR